MRTLARNRAPADPPLRMVRARTNSLGFFGVERVKGTHWRFWQKVAAAKVRERALGLLPRRAFFRLSSDHFVFFEGRDPALGLGGWDTINQTAREFDAMLLGRGNCSGEKCADGLARPLGMGRAMV